MQPFLSYAEGRRLSGAQTPLPSFNVPGILSQGWEGRVERESGVLVSLAVGRSTHCVDPGLIFRVLLPLFSTRFAFWLLLRLF